MMDLTRRGFIGSSLAAIAASSMPAFALGKLVDHHRQSAIAAIKAQFTKYMDWQIKESLSINPDLIRYTTAQEKQIIELMVVSCLTPTTLCSEVAIADATAISLEGCLSNAPAGVERVAKIYPWRTIKGYYCRRRIHAD